jgi:autotransporter translocation and assembly factor TamB
MRRALRWLGRAVLAIVVLAVAAAGAGALYLRSEGGARLLEARAESAVAAMGGRLAIGRVEVRSLGRIELDDVRLSFGGQSTVRADRVAIAWSPIALAWGEVRVSTLALERPRVRLVRRDDTWGLERRAARGPGPRIRLAQVRVTDGRLAVSLAGGAAPRRLVLRDLHGEAGATIGWLHRAVDVRALTGRVAGVRAPALSVRGDLTAWRHSLRIDAQLATPASTVALALARTSDGRIRLNATTAGLAPADVRRLLPGWQPPAGVAFTIRASGPLAALETTASVDVGPAIALRATGTVDVGAWPPHVDLALAGSHVDVDRLGRVEADALRVRGGGAPLAADVDGVVRVAGGRLTVDGRLGRDAEGGLDARTTFEADDVEPWLGMRGTAQGTARLARGHVEVDVASVETARAVGSASVDVAIAERTGQVHARLAAAGDADRAGTIDARVTGLGRAWRADVVLDATDRALGAAHATASIAPTAAGAAAHVETLVLSGAAAATPWRLVGPTTVRWERGVIATDGLAVARGSGRIGVGGRVRPTTGDDALDLTVTAQAVDVADLRDWVPAGIDTVAGRLDAEVAVRGPLAAPALGGGGTLVATSAHVVGIGTLEDLRVRVRGTSGDVLAIESLEARAGTGTISGSGSIGLASGGGAPIEAALRLRQVPIARRPLYEGVLAGRVTVDGTVAAPRLHADLRVPRGVVRPRLLPEEGANLGTDSTITIVGEPEPEPAPSAAAALAPVAIDATVALGDAVYIRRKDADVRLGGTLELDKDRDGPLRVRGPITLAEGWYVFKGRRFDLRSGTIRFTGEPKPDPELQIRARYRAPGYVVWVDVGGVASSPTLALSSEPVLSEADVLAVLLFGRPANELRSEQQGVVRQEAQSVAFSYAAPALEASVRKVLPIDRVEVSGQEFLVARQVTRDVFISLSQDLTQRGGQSVGMEYDLTPRTSLKLSTSSRGSGAIDFFWRRRY